VDDGGVAVTNNHGDTREWLEDIIPTLVEYPLANFNVYAILSQDAQSHIQPDRALFVIEIMDSPHAPHQAQDQRYYIRVGGKSKPASHRMVNDIIGRRRFPKVELSFAIRAIRSTSLLQRTNLLIKACNVGRVYAEHVTCRILLPSSLANHHPALFEKNIVEVEGQRFLALEKSNLEDGKHVPILPNLEHSWEWELPDSFNPDKLDNNEKVHWEVHADNAPINKGQIDVRQIPFKRNTENIFRVAWASFDRRERRNLIISILLMFAMISLVQLIF
jgi:hypothetical protein